MLGLREADMPERLAGTMSQLDKTNSKYWQLVGLMKFMVVVSRARLVVDGQLQWRTIGDKRSGCSMWARVKRWWPELVLILYIVCKIHILIFLYYKYEHDFTLIQLEQIKQKNNGTSGLTSSQIELMHNLARAIQEAGASIDLIGGQRTQDNFLKPTSVQHCYIGRGLLIPVQHVPFPDSEQFQLQLVAGFARLRARAGEGAQHGRESGGRDAPVAQALLQVPLATEETWPKQSNALFVC